MSESKDLTIELIHLLTRIFCISSGDMGHLVNTGLLGGHFNHLADIDTNKSIAFWLCKSEKTF